MSREVEETPYELTVFKKWYPAYPVSVYFVRILIMILDQNVIAQMLNWIEQIFCYMLLYIFPTEFYLCCEFICETFYSV
jgi:hypothetical protein